MTLISIYYINLFFILNHLIYCSDLNIYNIPPGTVFRCSKIKT